MLEPPYQAAGPSLLNRLVMGSRVGHGSTVVQGRIQSLVYTAGSTGWAINSDGTVEFDSGYFRGDITGATGTFSGAVTASSIDIGSGFHVDSLGNVWWGAAASYVAATNKISSSGQITFTTGSINLGSGAFVVTNGGVVTATSITLTGSVTAASGSSLPATYFSSGTIPAGVTITMTDAASVSIKSGDFVTGTSGWAIFGDGSAEFSDITARGVFKTAESAARIEIGSTTSVEVEMFSVTNSAAGYLWAQGSYLMLSGGDGSPYPRMLLHNNSTTGNVEFFGPGDFTATMEGDVYLTAGPDAADQGIVELSVDGGTSKITIDGRTGVDDITVTAADAITLDAAGILNLDGATQISFKQGGTEYARMDNSSGEGYLEVFSTGSLNGGRVYLRAGSGATSTDDVLLRHITGSGTDWLEIRGTTTGQIAIIDIGSALYSKNSSGGRALEVSSGNIIYSNTSSAAIKEDIQPIDVAEMWEKVERMELVTFKPKPEFDASGHGAYEFGGTAEQIATVEPRLVSFDIEEDGELTPYGLHYARFGVVALALVRDLKRQVRDLEARLAATGL